MYREFEVGEIVQGKYKVEAVIGRGSIGIVYRVNQILIGKRLALKTLAPQLRYPDNILQRFKQEAETTFDLRHPNLVKMHDFGWLEDGRPYSVMELVAGDTLASWLQQRKTLTITESVSLVRQVCFGLAYAHDLGIVHRDIKPSNIILAKNHAPFAAGDIKVTDFGLAKLTQHEEGEIQALTRTGEILGSPIYMSPEQCTGVSVDHRSDIYSLGCVLYELLTGTPPFKDDTVLRTMMRHASNERVLPLQERLPTKAFPELLETVVSRMLAKDPAQRYQNLLAVTDDLATVEAEELHGQGDTAALHAWINYLPKLTAVTKPVSIPLRTAIAGCAMFFCIGMLGGAMSSRSTTAVSSAEKAPVQDTASKEESTNRIFPTQDLPAPWSEILLINGQKVRRFHLPFLCTVAYGHVSVVADPTHQIVDVPYGKAVSLCITDKMNQLSSSFFTALNGDEIQYLTLRYVYRIAPGDPLKTLNRLTSLRTLDFAISDKLPDEVLDSISSIKSLEVLNVAQANTRKLVTSPLLHQLRTLKLGPLAEVTPILRAMKGAKNLRGLQLSACQLTREDLALIAAVPNLAMVWLPDCTFNQADLSQLQSLQHLSLLDISNCSVTSAIIPVLKKLDHLRTLKISLSNWSSKEQLELAHELPNLTHGQYSDNP